MQVGAFKILCLKNYRLYCDALCSFTLDYSVLYMVNFYQSCPTLNNFFASCFLEEINKKDQLVTALAL